MSSVTITWKGKCRSLEARARLLQSLHRLARLSESYLRPTDRPHLTVVGEDHTPSRANIEVLDEVRRGEILVSTEISETPELMASRAHEAGLPVRASSGSADAYVVLDEAHLQGIDFRLFDPKGLYPENDRMSFVFLNCPEYHFLDGRLVKVVEDGDRTLLECPDLQLKAYLEDWTDCLFAWIRFFLMGDLWWRRYEELQGYHDYRGVFEVLQTTRGVAEAEEATFDAVFSTFMSHAEHERCEVQRSA